MTVDMMACCIQIEFFQFLFSTNWSKWSKYSHFSKSDLALQIAFRLQRSKEFMNYESHKVIKDHKSTFQFNSNSYLNIHSLKQSDIEP